MGAIYSIDVFLQRSLTKIEAMMLEKAISISQLLKTKGIECPPFSDLSRAKFKTISDDEKRTALKSAIVYEDSIYIAIGSNIFEKPREEFNQFIKRRGIFCRLLAFQQKESPDMVFEIYDMRQIQIWRSSNFWRFTSYDVLSVLLFEWYILFQRDHNLLEATKVIVAEMLGGPTQQMPMNMRSTLREGAEFDGVKHKPHVMDAEFFEVNKLIDESTDDVCGLTCNSIVHNSGAEDTATPIRQG